MARQRRREATTPAKKAPKKPRFPGGNDLAARLAVVDLSKIWYPRQPVAVTTAAASRLAQLAAPERVGLWRIPDFDPAWIDELPTWARKLTEAENAWQAAKARERDGSGPALVKEGRKLRSELVKSARYLFRNDDVVLARLKGISRGRGAADLAMDLFSLEKLVTEHREAFAADESLPADVVARLTKLREQLGFGSATPEEALSASDAFENRNRLYAVVLEAVRELRAALRFRWRNQREKLAMLGVSYVAQQKRASRARKKAAAKKAKEAKTS